MDDETLDRLVAEAQAGDAEAFASKGGLSRDERKDLEARETEARVWASGLQAVNIETTAQRLRQRQETGNTRARARNQEDRHARPISELDWAKR